ncbi:sigma 54-interacting transcriptional regulator [Escherichia coli]
MGRDYCKCSGRQDVSAFSQIVAVQPKMKHVVEQAQKLAMLSAPLLITGNAAGKNLFAYALPVGQAQEQANLPGAELCVYTGRCGRSELFGNAPEGKKGFFEQANGGSVLLDEIGGMSPRMQAKLLHFLMMALFHQVGEDHEVHVDVRVICTIAEES